MAEQEMRLERYMEIVAGSQPEDWLMIERPTLRHRFTPMLDDKEQLIRQIIDEPMVGFSYRPDVRLTLLFGLVEMAQYPLPAGIPYAEENARTVLLHCLYEGQLIHTETLLKVDRQRCILPMPVAWGEPPQAIPRRQHDLARLVHQLAGPFTDFEQYFKNSGMAVVERPWP
ncbi:hypothetical protein [Oceanibaculum indicum]|nr:hypothetical protein [Oceanibaculum indicum]